MLLDIVILPPRDFRKKLSRLSDSVKKVTPLSWRVDDASLVPHISLNHIKVETRVLHALEQDLAIISKSVKKLPLKIRGPNYFRNYFGLDVFLNSALYNLHTQVLKKLNCYSAGPMKPIFPFKKTNLLQTCYIKKYGKPGVLRYFHPHITLGWQKKILNDKKIDRILEQFKGFSFIADELSVCKIDKFWQVTKILKTFRLKSPGK